MAVFAICAGLVALTVGCASEEVYIAPASATIDHMGSGLGERTQSGATWLATNSVAHVGKEVSQGDSTWRVIGTELQLCRGKETPRCVRVDTGGVAPDTLMFAADDAKWNRRKRRAILAGASRNSPSPAPGPAAAPPPHAGRFTPSELIAQQPDLYADRVPPPAPEAPAAVPTEAPPPAASSAAPPPPAPPVGLTPPAPPPPPVVVASTPPPPRAIEAPDIAVVNAVWVRGVPGSVLSAGVGLVAYCVGGDHPRCVPAKFPVEDGFVKAVLSVHRLRLPEPTDVVWLGLGDSVSTFWWGAAATEFTPVRCTATPKKPEPACQIVKFPD